MRNYLVFGGIDTRDYGIYISGNKRQNIPQRPYEVAQIEGRMGDLIVGGNMLANEEIVYPAFCAPVNGAYGNYASYQAAISAFRNALLSVTGYATLTDSYDTGHYRKAVFTGPITIETTDTLEAGSFDLVFNAKPQRYIVGGDTPETVSAGSSKTVACVGKRSAPIITVTSTGKFSFGGNTVRILENDSVVIVDSERMECYDENGFSENLTTKVPVFPQVNKPFTTLSTAVTISATGVDLSIVFNWYEL